VRATGWLQHWLVVALALTERRGVLLLSIEFEVRDQLAGVISPHCGHLLRLIAADAFSGFRLCLATAIDDLAPRRIAPAVCSARLCVSCVAPVAKTTVVFPPRIAESGMAALVPCQVPAFGEQISCLQKVRKRFS
jgi:hypothetical protein